MNTNTRALITLASAVTVGTGLLLAQGQKAPPKRGVAPPPPPAAVFRTTTNFHEVPVIVHDKDGKFIPDLKADDFTVLEDGVPQKVSAFIANVGGRIMGATTPAPEPTPETDGLVLPPTKVQSDVSGRVFVVFIDDLHFEPEDSPRVKDVLKLLRDTVIHDNDLVGFVSTGTSVIAVSPTYDYNHQRFNEAINRVMGSAENADEIIQGAMTEGSEGPTAIRYNTHVAFQTAYDMIAELSEIRDRRKSFIYVSEGYDFNPYTQARLLAIQNAYAEMGINPDGSPLDTTGNGSGTQTSSVPDPTGTQPADPMSNPDYQKRTEFADADLTSEIAELVRTARNGDVAFYTVDPRGLVGGMNSADMHQALAYSDWRDTLNTQLSSLKVLAEETGGFCTCETNDFKKAFQRIDNETSDYYIIGFSSNNTDPTKIRRHLKIDVHRPDVATVNYQPEYTIMRPAKSKITVPVSTTK